MQENSLSNGLIQLSLLTLGYSARGQATVILGVLILNSAADQLWMNFSLKVNDFAHFEDVEVLSFLAEDLRSQAERMGGRALVAYLEETLSNTLLISDRVLVKGIEPELVLTATTEVIGGPFPGLDRVAQAISALSISARNV